MVSNKRDLQQYDCGTAVVPFPGLTALPNILDGDGLYNHVNGNGRKNYNDVMLYFKHIEWIKTNQPVECFNS
jgi:PKD repeat protein